MENKINKVQIDFNYGKDGNGREFKYFECTIYNGVSFVNFTLTALIEQIKEEYNLEVPLMDSIYNLN